MILQIQDTTDGMHVGKSFSIPSLPEKGTILNLGSLSMTVLNVEQLGPQEYRISNFNYIILVRIKE